MKGRKPKPTALKVIQGNPGKRPLPENEPKPKPIAPECPTWLHEDAKKEWDRVAPELERLGLLTVVDMVALAGYCESWAQWKDAIEFIHKHGTVYSIKDDEGKVKYLQQVPQVSIANKAQQQIRAWCAEFGLTPSSRGRMNLPGQKDENAFEDFLNRGQKKAH